MTTSDSCFSLSTSGLYCHAGIISCFIPLHWRAARISGLMQRLPRPIHVLLGQHRAVGADDGGAAEEDADQSVTRGSNHYGLYNQEWRPSST